MVMQSLKKLMDALSELTTLHQKVLDYVADKAVLE